MVRFTFQRPIFPEWSLTSALNHSTSAAVSASIHINQSIHPRSQITLRRVVHEHFLRPLFDMSGRVTAFGPLLQEWSRALPIIDVSVCHALVCLPAMRAYLYLVISGCSAANKTEPAAPRCRSLTRSLCRGTLSPPARSRFLAHLG